MDEQPTDPHPSGETSSSAQPPTEATPAADGGSGGGGAFQWARGVEADGPVAALVQTPPPAPLGANGFRDERPKSHVRLVSMNARSLRVPAILFGISVLATIVVFIGLLAGLVGLGRSSFQFDTSLSRSDCAAQRLSVERAALSYYAQNRRVATSTQQLVDDGMLDKVPLGYRLTSTGDVVARSPGPCTGSRAASDTSSIAAATLVAIGIAMLVLFAAPLLLMWWLYRAYRSLPAGRRHFSALWAFSPLLWFASAIGMRFLIGAMVDPNESVNSVDSIWLTLTFLFCWLALWYLYGGVVRRVGTMFDVMGDHFARTSWPGRLIQWYGTWVMLLVPAFLLAWVLALFDNSVSQGISLAIVVVYYLGLVLLYLATIVGVFSGVIIVTLAQDRAMKDHAALMTEERLDHLARQRALTDAMAGLRAAPLSNSGHPTA